MTDTKRYDVPPWIKPDAIPAIFPAMSAAMQAIEAVTSRDALPVDRFWKYVNKTDECWLWTGAIQTWGYGAFSFSPKKQISAHRFSWKIANGDPGKNYVLHRCDVRRCVNPAHLFLGAQADNVRDMVSKKRQLFGERQAQSKLTDNDVERIRVLAGEGKKQRSIARMFGVTQALISLVVTRQAWKHI